MVSNPRFDFVYVLLDFYYTCRGPSKPCFDFVFDLLVSRIFPNPSKRRPGELRALVVPLEKVSYRLILKMCHVFCANRCIKNLSFIQCGLTFACPCRMPRVVVGLYCVTITALLLCRIQGVEVVVPITLRILNY